MQRNNAAVGCDGEEQDMTTTIKTAGTSVSTAGLLPILFVAVLGAGLTFLVGIAQSQTLHDAAHDVRHATGFPCH